MVDSVVVVIVVVVVAVVFVDDAAAAADAETNVGNDNVFEVVVVTAPDFPDERNLGDVDVFSCCCDK